MAACWVAMAKPVETVWSIEEHTKAKRRILRGYLDASPNSAAVARSLSCQPLSAR
jgi:hypothetical protein